MTLQEKRHQRVLQRIAQWESKKRRAENALEKLYKQRRYYERAARRAYGTIGPAVVAELLRETEG